MGRPGCSLQVWKGDECDRKMSEEARPDWEGLPSGLKVLAVDDDPLCLKVVERMLRRCNYEGDLPPASLLGMLALH